ncbi:MAG: DegT/DnrJ/EryC1/StrS family aminotransferase [Myxococcaceae bacterium]
MTTPRLYLSPPHMGPDERRLLLDAFDSNWVAPLGPHVDAFEKEMSAKVAGLHCVALSSGTAGLHLALQMLGVSRDDEVLVSSLTFAASANPVTYLGAKPVFIDAEAVSWNMDPALLAEELEACAKRGKLPRAVVAVDLYGQCADYDALLAACAKYQVPLIEDAAEALGATYQGKPAGTFGAMAALSFNGNKIITTSGGGMLLARDEAFATKARFLAQQARDPAPHYEHSHIGYNYRLSNLLAAVGRGQLSVLEERVKVRRATNAFYRQALREVPGVAFLPLSTKGEWNAWLSVVTIDPKAFGVDRETVRLALEKENIESRPVWKPMHLQPVFKECRVRGGKVGDEAFANGLCLPSGTAMTDSDRQRVVEVIRRVQRR